MNRLRDWEPRLVQYLHGVAASPPSESSAVCAIFAAGAVEAQTGTDLLRGWRRPCRSLRTALAAVKERGFENHVEYVAQLLSEVPPAFAHRGDVAVIEDNGAFALGIVQGESIYVMSPNGLSTLARARMVRAFKV